MWISEVLKRGQIDLDCDKSLSSPENWNRIIGRHQLSHHLFTDLTLDFNPLHTE